MQSPQTTEHSQQPMKKSLDSTQDQLLPDAPKHKIYIVARNPAQYSALSKRLEKSGLYTCVRVFSVEQLRGVSIPILFVLPKAWYSVRPEERTKILEYGRTRKGNFKVFEFTQSRFNKTLEELDNELQSLHDMLMSGSNGLPNSPEGRGN